MFSFLFKKEECYHTKITPDMDSGYCPDCGEYVENQWFLSRCSCCGIKQKTIIIKGEITAESNFCRNCGSSTFSVEKINKINFIDINYAVIVKTILNNRINSFTQSWVDKNEVGQLKFLTQQRL